MKPCPVCGAVTAHALYYKGEITLERCEACGFVSAEPTLDDYDSRREAPNINGWMYPERQAALDDIAARLARHSTGRLLDVGAGDGQFIAACQQHGFNCAGVEPSASLAESAARRTHTEVRVGYYDEAMYEPGSFDAIAMIQVLEHIPDPVAALRAARAHLRPGGIICIEVPSRWAPHFLLYQLTGRKAFIDPPRGVLPVHVGYHHPGSIRVATRRAGFREISLTTGRWAVKYRGVKRVAGRMIDPLLNTVRVGGILYLGQAV